jgi:hypothetical protein
VDQLSVGKICIFVSGFETLVMLAFGAMSFVILSMPFVHPFFNFYSSLEQLVYQSYLC